MVQQSGICSEPTATTFSRGVTERARRLPFHLFSGTYGDTATIGIYSGTKSLNLCWLFMTKKNSGKGGAYQLTGRQRDITISQSVRQERYTLPYRRFEFSGIFFFFGSGLRMEEAIRSPSIIDPPRDYYVVGVSSSSVPFSHFALPLLV